MLSSQTPLPGPPFPDAPQSGAFPHLQGLATSLGSPFPLGNHRDTRNRGGKPPQTWSLMWEAGCLQLCLLLACFLLSSCLPLTLFHSCLMSLCCPQDVACCPPLTPAGPPGTRPLCCWLVLHSGLFCSGHCPHPGADA